MSKLDEQIKSWEKLNTEMKGITSLLCGQDFYATKQDSYEDNGWGEPDEFPIDNHTLLIGETMDDDYETNWKLDTVFRMLDENLDYGQYNEAEDEVDRTDYKGMYHSAMMDLRCTVAEFVADKWVKTNEVYDLESAQNCANNYIKTLKFENFLPIGCK